MFFGDGVPVAQEDAARPVDTCIRGVRSDQPNKLLMQGTIVAGTLLVENDEIGSKAAQT